MKPNTEDNIKQVNRTKIALKATTRIGMYIKKKHLIYPITCICWTFNTFCHIKSNVEWVIKPPSKRKVHLAFWSTYDWHFSYVYITNIMFNNYCCYLSKRFIPFYNWYHWMINATARKPFKKQTTEVKTAGLKKKNYWNNLSLCFCMDKFV